MPSSENTLTITLHVDNARRFMAMFGGGIGEGKRYENVSQAFNDVLANMLDFIENMISAKVTTFCCD